MLLEGRNNAVAILQRQRDRGFYVDAYDGNGFRDRWGDHDTYVRSIGVDDEVADAARARLRTGD